MKNKKWDRRKFIGTASALLGASVVTSVPVKGFANEFLQPATMTIQDVINLIQKSVPGAPFKSTVDTIKSGNANQPVKGIVTTMFATVDVIEKTAGLGANFIIAHEPSFYNHADETNWLEKDAVYQYKWALLKKHDIVIWRFHDYIHAHQPDGVQRGVQDALGWTQYADSKKPWLVNLPAAPLQSIISHVKKNLGIAHLRFVGDRNQICSKVVIIPGAAGGRMQINAIATENPDLLVVGEINEWETSEYVRDLRASGAKTSLLVLGHVVSEEPGMQWLLEWLQPQVKPVKVTHIPSTDAFSWA